MSHLARHRRGLIAGAIAFAVALVLGALISLGYVRSVDREQRTRAYYVAESVEGSFLIEMNRYVDFTTILKNELLSDGGTIDNFESVASALYDSGVVKSIQLAPDGVVRYAYPAGSATIGYDIFADDNNAAAVEQMLATKRFTVMGPTVFVQGGEGFIIRNPIYVLDGDDTTGSTLWGFSTVLVNTPDIFERVNFDQLNEQGYAFELAVETDVAGRTVANRSGEEMISDVVTVTHDLGLSTWTLSVYPKEGWYGSLAHPLLVALALVFALVTGAVVALLVSLQEQRDANRREQLALREVVNDAGMLYFVCNPTTGVYEARNVPAWAAAAGYDMEGFPDSLIDNLALSADEGEKVKSMVRSLQAGEAKAEQILHARIGEHGRRVWINLRLLNLAEEAGGESIVGYGENVDTFKLDSQRLEEELLRMQALQGDLVSVACVDVTRDTDRSLSGTSGEYASNVGARLPQDVLEEARELVAGLDHLEESRRRVMVLTAADIPNEDQRRQYLATVSREGLMHAYEQGKWRQEIEHCRWYQGKLTWMLVEVCLLKDPSNGHVLAFIYTHDIDDRKKNEQIVSILINKGCDFVSLVNVVNRTVRFRFMSESIKWMAPELTRETELDYEQGLLEPLSRLLTRQGWREVRPKLELDHIVASLESSGSYGVAMDLRPIGMVSLRKQVQFYWMDENHNEVLCVQTDTTEAHRREVDRERLRREAHTDALTGLLNRRGIHLSLDDLEALHKHTGEPFVFAMGDIDFFKKVNDTYGHDAGDKVLAGIADMLEEFASDGAMVGRLGGEEFLIASVGETASEVAHRLEEFIVEVENHTFVCGSDLIKITMTFGVNEYNERRGIHETLQEVDAKLYHGKENGRNQVVY